jgi:hypothetical protein
MVIRRVKGDTYPIRVQVLQENGESFDLTGCTAFFTCKKRYEDPDNKALIALETTSFESATEGIIAFEVTEEQTEIDGSFFYDVKVKDANDLIYSVVADRIIFEKNITIRTS